VTPDAYPFLIGGRPTRRIAMAKARRGSKRGRSEAVGVSAPDGTGGFFGQVGLFETANGLPHGPAAIALAIIAAVVVYPITRLVAWLRRR
jgi:hypothetical protein